MAASIHDNPLRQACKEVMEDREVRKRYPEGLDSADILREIRVKAGADVFPLVTILDVHDEMEALYGRPDRPGGR